MAKTILSIRCWPDQRDPFFAAGQLRVFAILTPQTPIRDAARQRVRAALRDILAADLGMAADALPLLSQAGQPLRLDLPGTPVGLSVSHETGLSLIAIAQNSRVGVDLLRQTPHPDWRAEIPTLARDYLPPPLAKEIATLPPDQQAARFAAAWTQHEARLKCLGTGLEEWTPPRQTEFDQCTCIPLPLPAGFVGHIASARRR